MGCHLKWKKKTKTNIVICKFWTCMWLEKNTNRNKQNSQNIKIIYISCSIDILGVVLVVLMMLMLMMMCHHVSFFCVFLLSGCWLVGCLKFRIWCCVEYFKWKWPCANKCSRICLLVLKQQFSKVAWQIRILAVCCVLFLGYLVF